jgi:hypothetical protein
MAPDPEPIEIVVARLDERVKALTELVGRLVTALLGVAGSILVGVVVYVVTTQ